jgi:carboxypeptidase Q
MTFRGLSATRLRRTTLRLTAISVVVLTCASARRRDVVQIGNSLSSSEVEAIKHNALDSGAYSWLEELTDSIGPRVTGSIEATKAIRWAAHRMELIGLTNVHVEPWHMRGSWRRKHSHVEMTRPIHLPLNVVSYGWTGSTPRKGIEAPLVLVNRAALPEELSRAQSWAGKIVFVAAGGPRAVDPVIAFSQLADLVSAAQAARALAVISRDLRPGTMLTHTGPISFDDSFHAIPVLDIASEHQQLVERLLKSGTPVAFHMSIENEFSSSSVESANVVGEIRGNEQPDQVVVLGAHLDSWDLGTGAIDDGFGVAAMLGVADAIIRSGVKPRRTVRLLLFTGEEQGLLGSRAWLREHRADIPDIVCALVLDWGAGPITELPLGGHSELAADLKIMSDTVSDIQLFKVRAGYLTFTDAYSFTLAGLPGLAFLQDSPNYTEVGHSAADTLDKVNANTLLRNIATVAMTALWIANHLTRMGTAWPTDTTAQRLTDDGQRTLLRLFRLWPFGP